MIGRIDPQAVPKIRLATGQEIPCVGMGTFGSDHFNAEQISAAVAGAIRCGYRLFDCAAVYGNEAEIGEVFQRALDEGIVRREELFITSKVWNNMHGRGDVLLSAAQTLKDLRLDYIDAYFVHWPFANYYAAWRNLEPLYEEGIIRAIGVSNFEPDRLIDLIAYNKVKPAVNQIETHLYCQRTAEHEWEEKYGVAHMAYAPLGQGRTNEMFSEPIVVSLAEKYGKTPAQILLRRTVQDGVAVIPKSSHPERIAENLGILDFALTAEEMTALQTLDKASPMIGNSEKPELVEMAMKW